MTRPTASSHLLLLTLNTDDMSTTTGGFCVLPADLQVMVMANTTLATGLAETLQVHTMSGGYGVNQDMHVLTGLEIIVTVEHPGGDAVREGVLKYLHESILLGCCELSSTLVDVNVGLLESNIGKAAPDPLNSDKGTLEHNLPLDVRVEHTQEVSVVAGLDNRCHREFKRTGYWSQEVDLK